MNRGTVRGSATTSSNVSSMSRPPLLPVSDGVDPIVFHAGTDFAETKSHRFWHTATADREQEGSAPGDSLLGLSDRERGLHTGFQVAGDGAYHLVRVRLRGRREAGGRRSARFHSGDWLHFT